MRGLVKGMATLSVALGLPGCTGGSGALSSLSQLAQPKREIYSQPYFTQEGVASWYGGRWIGRKTANGEIYHAGDFTAAHRTLPFGTILRVTDLKTGKSVMVRVNNRGPYVRGRILDLSVAAARELGTYHRGIAKVRIEAVKPIPIIEKPNLKVTQRGP